MNDSKIKIGIIGAGHIGGNAARLFVKAGHEVVISNSRGPESLDELVDELGDNASAGTVEMARDFGDVVFVSIPLYRFTELPTEGWDEKVVIDSNNYYPDRDGQIAPLDAGETTSSELLERHLPGARIVKAFNTIWFEHLRSKGDTALALDKRHVIFVAGDDSEAKAVVARLIEDIGFAAGDAGFLKEGGKLMQPNGPLYNKEFSGADARKAIAAGA